MQRINKRPSPALRDWLAGELAGFVDDGSLGNWPRRIAHKTGTVIVDGNGAFIWYLDLSGNLFRLDTDDITQKLEPVDDQQEYRQVLRAAATRHPQLAELLDDSPATP